jgi:hypothetical protein
LSVIKTTLFISYNTAPFFGTRLLPYICGHPRPRMASLTPGRKLNLRSPSQPNLNHLANNTAVARKASLNALTGQQPPTAKNKMGADGRDIEVGDPVDVPGGMNGVVKFVGIVRGKPGMFAGVELSREFAARGKNDGDVEGYAHALKKIYSG